MKMISIVIPMLNEAETVPELLRRIHEIKTPDEVEFEICIVDDGSSDQTASVAEQWFGLNHVKNWKIIRLTRNFGHQSAYLAGLKNSNGDAVITMDADLQDPPEVIPELIMAWRQGARLVNAVRISRKETGWRRGCFDSFHYLFFRLTGGIMPRNTGNFCLMDRVVADHLKNMPEGNLFLPALRNWIGYEKAEVYYHRQGRERGDAKMNWKRLTNLAWAGVTSFSTVPLKLIGWLGLIIALPSFAWAGVLVTQRCLQGFGFLSNLEVLGFTTVAVAILSFGSVQLICLGVIGEYLGRIYQEVKQRPQFLVMEIISSSDSQKSSTENK